MDEVPILVIDRVGFGDGDGDGEVQPLQPNLQPVQPSPAQPPPPTITTTTIICILVTWRLELSGCSGDVLG